MACSAPVYPLVDEGANPPNPSGLCDAAFLKLWDSDIRRAARAAWTRGVSDREDLAQQVRIRVLVGHRSQPSAGARYIRTVITNTLRTVRRRESRSLSVHSPLPEKLTERLAAATDQPVDDRVAAVSAWAANLPPRLAEIYQYLYVDGRSQRDAAKLMRVSQPRIAQLHSQLLARGHRDLESLAA
jgi:RNA polymerase sigma factor (sigma-70 family)